MPVQAATTVAMSSGPTSSETMGGSASVAASADASSEASASSFSRAGIRPYSSSEALARSPSRWARSASMRSSSSDFFSSPTRLRPDFSASHRAVSAASCSFRSARSRRNRTSRSAEAASDSRASASSSIFSRSTARCSSSISVGLESISMRRRDADSSIRSIALSGRNRRGDVPIGQGRRSDQRGVGDPDPVVRLVALLEPPQDTDRVLHARLTDQHLLEPALQGRVLLDVTAVLVQRRGTDHPQLTPGEHRLEHVAGVHRTLAGRTGADHGVQFVDEGDDLPVGALDLVEDGLQPLLELAAVLRPGDHRAKVQRDQPLAAQRLRHVAGHDSLGQALDDSRLANAGFADQHRVVLGPAGQHLHHAPNLRVAADDRIDGALAGLLGQVDAVFLQRLERPLGIGGGHLSVTAADDRECLDQRVGGGAGGDQDVADVGAGSGQRGQQVLGGKEFITTGPHDLLGAGHDVRDCPGKLRLGDGGALGRRQPGQDRARPCGDRCSVDADRPQQTGSGGTFGREQRGEQVRRLHHGIAGRSGGTDGRGQHLTTLGGQDVGVHVCSSTAFPVRRVARQASGRS